MNKYEKWLFCSPEVLPWNDYDKIQSEASEAQKTVATARGIINDAVTRYKKKKLNARNKKQAEDMTVMFADINQYASEREIDDAYGWDFISEKERDRLIELWRKREKMVDESGKYSDPVIDVLNKAVDEAFAPIADLVSVASRMKSIRDEQERKRGQS